MFGSALAMGALSFVITADNIGRHGLSAYDLFVSAIAVGTMIGSAIALYVQRDRRRDRVWWTR
jgi:hypothetical protein